VTRRLTPSAASETRSKPPLLSWRLALRSLQVASVTASPAVRRNGPSKSTMVWRGW
jgi:hypothetical protein